MMAACASADRSPSSVKSLDERIAEEQITDGAEALREETAQNIQNDPDLSANQKTKLLDLQKATTEKMRQLHIDSLKLKSVLSKSLFGPDYNERDIQILKRRIVKNDNKKLDVMFEALDEAKKILGKNGRDHAYLMNQLLSIDRYNR